MSLVTLDQISDPFVTACIYGTNGVGKTVLACGSQHLRTFVFDCEKGMLSVMSKKTDEKLIASGLPPIKRENIRVWTCENYSDFEKGLEHLIANVGRYDLGVIDTSTELQRIVLAEVKAKSKHIIADQQDWGKTLDVMEAMCRAFRNMKMHSIFTAHERSKTNPSTGSEFYRPFFQGQFADNYGKHFSLIARYQVVDQQVIDPVTGAVSTNVIRFLNCIRDGSIDAKDRSSALDKYEVPYLDNILYKIQQAVNQS